MLFTRIKTHPAARIALQDENRTIRYGDLDAEIRSRIDSLTDVRVLGLAMDNCVDWVLWDLAALKAHIPCVPIPPFFSAEQRTHLLRTAGVSHIAAPDGLRANPSYQAAILPQGTAKITFTSGTTGTPKGVCLSRRAMEDVVESLLTVLGDDFTGIHVSVLPLSVLLENLAGVYAGLAAGCTIRLHGLQSFGHNDANIHDVLKNSHATSVILVPEILRLLMAQTALKGSLPAVKFIAVGGSKTDAALITQARAMGLPVYEGFGLSEAASVVALNTPAHDRPGTVGKLLPHIRATVKDGEVCLQNPGFLGYIGEAAPAIFPTGDLGHFDADGFLSITGRRKNVLITSYGRNISPEWVEAALLTSPAIAQVVVYGDAQPHLSALIVPSSPQAAITDAVAQTNTTLPDYAQIKEFQIVPSFTVADGTLTGNGRPRRASILSLYTKEKTDELLQQTC